MIPAFPKIFTLGDRFTTNLFDGPVEITEKIDGSQFNFGKVQDTVWMRSKGAQVFFEDTNKMFNKAKTFVERVMLDLPEGVIFHGEYLQAPRHNTLTYGRVPKSNFMLFGTTGSSEPRSHWAELLGCEEVPILFEGEVTRNDRYEWLMEFVSKESVLGLAQREGIVIKNYGQSIMVGEIPIPFLSAKMVSTEFKEKHKVAWSDGEGRDKLTLIGEAFNAKPRWEKAIQRLNEKGELSNSPKDIGPLLKEIHLDIEAEEKDNIKDLLWDLFAKDIKRIAVRGFPEYYKEAIQRTIASS